MSDKNSNHGHKYSQEELLHLSVMRRNELYQRVYKVPGGSADEIIQFLSGLDQHWRCEQIG